jgi:hypothetical protein
MTTDTTNIATTDITITTTTENKPRQWKGGALYVALLVAGVFAAWQGHMLWFSPDRQTDPSPIGSHRFDPKMLEPSADQEDSFLPGEFDSTGMAPMDVDPGRLSPPEGAGGRVAVRREMGGSVVEEAVYTYAGQADAALSHYRDLLFDRGFAEQFHRQRSDGSHLAIFTAGDAKVVLALRKPAADRTIRSIVVRVIHPAR